MLTTIFYSVAALICKILFSPIENNIHIFVPPCNMLYIGIDQNRELGKDWNNKYMKSCCIYTYILYYCFVIGKEQVIMWYVSLYCCIVIGKEHVIMWYISTKLSIYMYIVWSLKKTEFEAIPTIYNFTLCQAGNRLKSKVVLNIKIRNNTRGAS